jgi:hypothetical protein
MQIPPHLQTVPLGWLPVTTAAQADSRQPVFRHLESSGYDYLEYWGHENPDLSWRCGHAMGDQALESALVLELLRRAAGTVTGAEDDCFPDTERRFQARQFKFSPARLGREIPSFNTVASAWLTHSRTAIALTSPRLPKIQTRTLWLAALPKILPDAQRKRLLFLTKSPARLVRVGYHMLISEWDAHGQGRDQTAEALAIIGLGAMGLFPRLRCEVCFRLATPGSVRCAQHSQTLLIRCEDLGAVLQARIASEAKLAKKVMDRMGWSRLDFTNNMAFSGHTDSNVIGSLLWGLWYGPDRDLDHIKDGLQTGRFPHVAKRLPPNFCTMSDPKSFACLRSRLDPNEWDHSNWMLRIFAAEEWLSTAETLSPGRLHMQKSTRNQERVGKARELLEKGLSKKLIAQTLGISPSHLSHLLKRN